MAFVLRFKDIPHQWFEYQGSWFLIAMPDPELIDPIYNLDSEADSIAVQAMGGAKAFYASYALIDWEGVTYRDESPALYSKDAAWIALSDPDFLDFVKRSLAQLSKQFRERGYE